VRHGAPAPEALALIRERRLDAVALTTHGHSGFLRSLFGSVAWEILRDGRVPAFVLTNRAYRQPLPAPAWNPRHLLIEG
jgi:nucleotide-binding universal stress UspA family protein